MNHPRQFVRLKQFYELMGWSRSTYYNNVKRGLVPKAYSNGPRTKGYFADQIAEIQKNLVG